MLTVTPRPKHTHSNKQQLQRDDDNDTTRKKKDEDDGTITNKEKEILSNDKGIRARFRRMHCCQALQCLVFECTHPSSTISNSSSLTPHSHVDILSFTPPPPPPPAPLAYLFVCLLVGCLTSQQHASVSHGRIYSDNCTCCHTEIEVADQTFHLTQSQYTDTGPTSPGADPITPGAWQGSHWSANSQVTGMTRPRKNLGASGIRARDLPLSRRTP